MSRPTQQQVDAEIALLKALKPIGRFARKTERSIQIAVEALQDQIDETSDEFNFELTDEEQMTARDAINWKNGDSTDRPSDGWGGLVQ